MASAEEFVPGRIADGAHQIGESTQILVTADGHAPRTSNAPAHHSTLAGVVSEMIRK